MNCLICELLSLREVWAGGWGWGGDSSRGWGRSIFTGEELGGFYITYVGGEEGLM